MRILSILLTVFLLLAPVIFSFAQSFNIEWQGCYGGNDTEYPKDIIAVWDGYLVTGTTKSVNGDISFNHGGTDAWIFKINNNGGLIWEKTYGGSVGDNADRIIPDGQGNFYIIGATNSDDGDISFDPYPDSWDFWIIKIDTTGNIIWEKVYGGSSGDVLWTATLTSDGGVIACGWTASDDGDVSTYYGLYDGWLIKVNSQGEKEWDFTIGTDGYDVCQAIIQTNDGGYLVGCASAIWDVGNITCDPFNEYAEAVLVKLDSNLNIEWNQCYGGSDNDGVTALIEVSDGYVFGGYAGSNDGDISGWHGEGDIWIVKVDYNGDIVWQKCLGGSDSEFISTLALTDEGDILIPGYTRSVDGDVTGNHTISEYEHDIWLVKISSEGDLLWEHCFGGIWDEQVNFGFIKKTDSNFVIAGQTDYGPSFDVACTPHGGNYDKDFWVFEVKDTLVGMQDERVVEKKFKVYPNPAKDYIVFEFDVRSLEFEVGANNLLRITNTFGQQIALLQVNSEKTVWDTRNIQNGIYFYSVENDKNVYSGKLVIQ